MYIKSEVGRLSRYGEDAVEAFRTAVNNGQARLGMQILVDVIDAFADKLDELSLLAEENNIVVTPEKEAEAIKPAPTVKEEELESNEGVTPAKAKLATKEPSAQ
jgi:hypothetical protein